MDKSGVLVIRMNAVLKNTRRVKSSQRRAAGGDLHMNLKVPATTWKTTRDRQIQR